MGFMKKAPLSPNISFIIRRAMTLLDSTANIRSKLSLHLSVSYAVQSSMDHYSASDNGGTCFSPSVTEEYDHAGSSERARFVTIKRKSDGAYDAFNKVSAGIANDFNEMRALFRLIPCCNP